MLRVGFSNNEATMYIRICLNLYLVGIIRAVLFQDILCLQLCYLCFRMEMKVLPCCCGCKGVLVAPPSLAFSMKMDHIILTRLEHQF